MSYGSRLADIRFAAGLALLASMSTLVAVMAGACVIFLMMLPSSLAVFIMPWVLIVPFYWACALAAPVTFGLLPLSAAFMRSRPLAAAFALPALGMIGGGASIFACMHMTMTGAIEGIGIEILLVTGMIAGLAAGAFFGRALLEAHG